jgi:hypothetical protein
VRFHRADTSPAAVLGALRHTRMALRSRVRALYACPDDTFVRDFAPAVAAVEAGFRHEEALLDRLGDPGLHRRRAEHAVILCALHRTMARVEEGDVRLGRQVAGALAAVLALPWPASLAARRPAHVGLVHHPLS